MEREDCLLCQLPEEEHDRIWHAYGARISSKDASKVATRIFSQKDPPVEIGEDAVMAHLFDHHWVQPSPLGKFNRSFALQEAMTSFPRHLLLLMRALYRAGALSHEQIYHLFYLGRASDSAALRSDLDRELRALTFRSFLFCHFPSNKGALTFEDEGPYYFINRQAIPLVEHLEGAELQPQAYTTSIAQVHEYMLEHDARFIDVIVGLREALYQRMFPYGRSQLIAHLGIEHWYPASQLRTELPAVSGTGVTEFSPAAVVAFRTEVRDGSMSTLIPLWIDYDRGTETPAQIADDLLLYAAYYGSDAYKRAFPRLVEHRTPGALLVVCEDAWRCQQVAEALAARIGDQPEIPLYLVDRPTVLKDPYAPGILTHPVQRDRRFGLVERVLHHARPLIRGRVFAPTDRLSDPLPATLLTQASTKRSGRSELVRRDSAAIRVDLRSWLGTPAESA